MVTGAPVLALLALIGLIGGVGITAVGPGGVLPTIGMFLLTGLSPAGVAGTAIVTHVATGALGTAVYTRSGQLRDPLTRHTAAVLAATAVVGTPIGVLLNSHASGQVFGILLACAVTATGLLVWLREHQANTANQDPGTDAGLGANTDLDPDPDLDPRTGTGTDRAPGSIGLALTTAVGLAVATAAGLFGVGGPMLSVPLLVVCGLPVLSALAAAQAQSVVIAGVGSIGYALHGSVEWGLAAVVGVPELAGVVVGWRIAHAVPARRLKYALAGTLLALAPYLALRS